MRPLDMKLRIGLLLVEYGAINIEQLEEALSIQRNNGGKIGGILIDLGYVTNERIIEVLEFQLGTPYVDLDDYEIEPEAVFCITKSLAKRHQLIPVKKTETELYVAMEDPLDIFAIDDVRIASGLDIVPMLTSEEQVLRAIDLSYGKEQAQQAAEEFKAEQELNASEGEGDEETSKIDISNAPIVKLVNSIIEQGIHSRASDIHIEPYENHIRVRFRIDGNLKEYFDYSVQLLPPIVARIKIVAGMDIGERRVPQDGRISITVDYREFDIRVSTLPTTFGEKVVMRLNSKEGFSIGKGALGFFDSDLEKFDGILSNPFGIILVTGPTGSGKSTTLYTSLSELNNEEINIVTVEDPVESKIEGINQVQVNEKAGLTFAGALRSILRQDPDVIMIGEIRDSETAEIAVKASITGHLVISTLHTNDAPSSITRLVDMGIEPFLIGASVVGIIAQRLVRKLCARCLTRSEATSYEKEVLGLPQSITPQLARPNGCHVCSDTGYSGRIGVYEIMPVDHILRTVINRGGTADEIRDIALSQGMKSLRANATRLVLDGVTTVDELLKIAYRNE